MSSKRNTLIMIGKRERMCEENQYIDLIVFEGFEFYVLRLFLCWQLWEVFH